MISRFIALGLLSILLFLSCKTVVDLEFEENRDQLIKKEIFVQAEEITPVEVELTDQEKIYVLVEEHFDNPELILKEIFNIIDEDDISFNDLISRLFIGLGQYEKGKDRILEIPNYQEDADLLKLLVISNMGLGDKYISDLERILEIDDSNLFALHNLADFFIRGKNVNKAEEMLFRAYDNEPTNKKTKLLFGDLELRRVDLLGLENKRVLKLKEEAVVKAHYLKALKYYKSANDITNPDYFTKISVVYNKLGEKLEAIEALDSAIDLDNSNEWNYFDRGKLYFYTNSYNKALIDFEKSYSLNPNHFFTNVFLGRVYFFLNNIELSLKHYQIALKMNPEYSPAYKDVSTLYYIIGDADRSLYYLTELYKTKQDRDPLLSLHLVNSLIESGEKDQSEKILKNLVKYEKNSKIKGIYQYYLEPQRTSDRVLNDALNIKEDDQRIRLSYYVACALDREGVITLSRSLFQEVAESNISYESKLAKYKLGEFNE